MQELFILTIWDPVKEVFLIIKLTRMMFKNTSKTFTVASARRSHSMSSYNVTLKKYAALDLLYENYKEV